MGSNPEQPDTSPLDGAQSSDERNEPGPGEVPGQIKPEEENKGGQSTSVGFLKDKEEVEVGNPDDNVGQEIRFYKITWKISAQERRKLELFAKRHHTTIPLMVKRAIKLMLKLDGIEQRPGAEIYVREPFKPDERLNCTYL